MPAKATKLQSLFKVLPYFATALIALVFFVGISDYIFYMQEQGGIFLCTWSYLHNHLSQPGGLLVYISNFFTAFYKFPLAGGIILTTTWLGIILFLRHISRQLTETSNIFIPFLFAGLLVWLQVNYRFQLLNHLGILMQLAAFELTLSFCKKNWSWLPVFLFPLWYFITGSFAVLYLVLLMQFLLTQNKGGTKLLVLLVVAGGFFYLADQYLFFRTTESLLLYPFSKEGVNGQATLFLIVVILIALFPLISWSFAKAGQKIERIEKWMPYTVVVGLTVVLYLNLDTKTAHFFQVEKAFYTQDFDKVIALNEQQQSTNKLTLYMNNLALAEKGRLNDRLFDFKQSPDGTTLFLPWEMVEGVLKSGGYFYYTLGIINEAQRWAYECMVTYGYTPENLIMLIKTELINGNYKVAAKYINILKSSLFYKTEAREFEKLLFNDEAVLADKELGQKRKRKVRSDFFVLSDKPHLNIEAVLEADSSNMMALQFKMATLLIRKDVQGLIDLLPVLDEMGIRQLPLRVEEAVITMQVLKPEDFPDLQNIRIRPETRTRFLDYSELLQRNNASKNQAQSAVYGRYKSTYWYYVFFV